MYVPLSYKDHDHKNMTMNRPMSPHLTIYAPTVPSVTSIFQRMTGITVTFYALLLSGGALFLTNGVETYVSILQSLELSRTSAFLIKFILGWPFAFHFCNGVRFCAFNAGRWLSMPEVFSTAYRAIILSGVIAFLFALV